MRKSIIELTIFQAIFILAWLITRTASWFFPALGVIVLCAAGMAIYLVITWRRQPVADRWQGVFAIAGWILIAWLVIKANGLTVVSFWG